MTTTVIIIKKYSIFYKKYLETLHYLGAEVPDPSTCSIRTCEYDPAWPHSVWITEKELEGCDCCLLPNGTLVPDGATWVDFNVIPPQLRECCRGQIVTPDPPITFCQANWSVFDGQCYKYFSEKETWDDAQDLCVEEQVRLDNLCLWFDIMKNLLLGQPSFHSL